MRLLEDNVVDGNAIGGLLIDLFGTEMTTVVGTCGVCGTRSQVAEMAVYRPRLGTVVRCRVCDNVLMVFVDVRGVTCVDLRGLAQMVLLSVGPRSGKAEFGHLAGDPPAMSRRSGSPGGPATASNGVSPGTAATGHLRMPNTIHGTTA